MSDSILTTKHAEDLNKLVQSLIDSRLFLLCNYEPTIRHAISEDGEYLLNIQDMYKFAIDSSCIIKQYRRILPQSDHWQFSDLRKLLDQISTFRAVFDHNISDKDGQLSMDEMALYVTWVRSAIGKSAPQTMDDFKILNQKLADMAAELLQSLERFIRCASRISDKRSVVGSWIDITLYWYSNNTKTDIYKGNLISAYIANSKASGTNTDVVYWRRGASRKVCRWIEEALCYPIQSKIDQANKEIGYIKDILDGKLPRFEDACRKLPSAKAEEMLNQFRRSLSEKQQELSRLECELELLVEKFGGDPVKYFYRNLENQLRETIGSLDQADISYTLLPQDLIQEDIARVFRGVPSPEHDF